MDHMSADQHVQEAQWCAEAAAKLLRQGVNSNAEAAKAWVRTGELHVKLAELKRNDGSL